MSQDEKDSYAAPGTILRRSLDMGVVPWPTVEEAAVELAKSDFLSTGRGAFGIDGTIVEFHVEVLICRIGTCPEPAQPEHSPCCSSHGALHGDSSASFCCEHYCNLHMVEVNRCSPAQHAEVTQ